jgi:hypothetical protein
MSWAAIDKADPENPVGAKGIGEPIQGCAAAALLCAISDAKNEKGTDLFWPHFFQNWNTLSPILLPLLRDWKLGLGDESIYCG